MHASQIRITIFSPFNQTNWRSGETSMYLDKILHYKCYRWFVSSRQSWNHLTLTFSLTNISRTHSHYIFLFFLLDKQCIRLTVPFMFQLNVYSEKRTFLFSFTVIFFLIYLIFLFSFFFLILRKVEFIWEEFRFFFMLNIRKKHKQNRPHLSFWMSVQFFVLIQNSLCCDIFRLTL